ncbi:MAG TPA: hypothetical protein VIK52_08130 [Opitutaceae bacterium]
MKTPPDPTDPTFEPLLNRIQPPPTAPLAREVWSRIAAGGSEAPESARPGLLAAIEAVFRQPAFAFAFVVACGLFGLLLAEMRVSRMHEARDVQLVQSYMRLIDPLLAVSDTAARIRTEDMP